MPEVDLQGQENTTPINPDIQEVPDTPEVPRHIEQGGVTSVPVHFTAQVQDDSGNQMITSPAVKKITIEIPATQEVLQDWAQGPPENSLTWYAKFWLRIIKKALFFGWRILLKGGS